MPNWDKHEPSAIIDKIQQRYFNNTRIATADRDQRYQRDVTSQHNSKSPRQVKVYCPFEENELVKVKGRKLETNPDIEKPRYYCEVCVNFYEGWKLTELRLVKNPDILAIVSVWPRD